MRFLVGLIALSLLSSCAGSIDRFTTRRLLGRASAVGDVGQACAMGQALARLVDTQGSPDHPPRQALVATETTAALCEESLAWDAELELLSLRAWPSPKDPAWVARVQDTSIVAARLHASTAARYHRAFLQLNAAFGPVGETCPRLAEREELVYVLGLFAGLNGLLHDRASGGRVGMELDIPSRVARAAACLDDPRWWYVPGAFQAAAWAMVPGSGPADVDPWARLESQASLGESTGVRLARALQIMLAVNAGRDQEAAHGIQSHAASLARVPVNPRQALLDTYATQVSLYLADRIWMEKTGHRAPALGPLPTDPPRTGPLAPAEDPFLAPPESSSP